MTKLQELAIIQINSIASEIGNDLISISEELSNKAVTFDAMRHTYPISKKVKEIESWTDALMGELD